MWYTPHIHTLLARAKILDTLDKTKLHTDRNTTCEVAHKESTHNKINRPLT